MRSPCTALTCDAQPSAYPPRGVRRIALPPELRRLSSFDRIDYHDAFLVSVSRVEERTAKQWANSILVESPARLRNGLRRGWIAIGLQLRPLTASGSVLGWELRRSSADHVLLGANSHLGLPAELIVSRTEDGVMFATLVQKRNPIARAVWAGIEPVHLRVVRDLLERARLRSQQTAAAGGHQQSL
jgi:Protein of unknown function (DUF2867)